MAQELTEELGRILHERGPIGSALGRIERNSGVRREHLMYGAAAVVSLMFAVNLMSSFLCQAISTLLGVLGSLRALERKDPAGLQKWTSYWLIYAILNVIFGWFVRLVGRYFVKIYLVKFLLLAWCALPVDNNGADYLYARLLAHRMFRPLVLTSGVPVSKKMPPMMTGGDERRSDKMRSSVPMERRAVV